MTESLSTTEKLTLREEELNRRLEKALHELDLVHQGMNSELDQRWEAEDEILQLQMEIDQVRAVFELELTNIAEHHPTSILIPDLTSLVYHICYSSVKYKVYLC